MKRGYICRMSLIVRIQYVIFKRLLISRESKFSPNKTEHKTKATHKYFNACTILQVSNK